MLWFPLVGVLLGLADRHAAAWWASGHAWYVTDGLHRMVCFAVLRAEQIMSGKARGTVNISAWAANPPGTRLCAFASLAEADYA